ncbi:hypothetical protein [Leptolyngbya sp. 7M]|uniref:hypothetical protein n=1 Tax=Leptolyngbya sp. 7M TaxID=2812896 RepID=UPI001B8C40A9|nr:hypothetical protein [Leptolyngbya sp. 7M]QYO65714.1 hypothetical protein JVX88_02680 [Leptolyngbya sp. 7M]
MFDPIKAVKEAFYELVELVLIPAEALIATVGLNRKAGLIGLTALLLVGLLIASRFAL